MHLALGNTYRGIIGGWLVAVCAALSATLTDEVSFKKTVAGLLLITGPVLGALVDRGSKPPKEDQPK